MEEERNYTVYMHRCPNGKCYVGMTSQTLEKRSGKNGIYYKTNKDFYNDILCYGWNNINHIILEENLSFDIAVEKEKKNIKIYNSIYPNGYNLSIGGDKGALGVKKTKEQLIAQSKRMKEWYKTHENPNIGRKQTEKNKMSKARNINIYNKDGEFIETILGMNDIVKKYNLKKPEIVRCCKDKSGILLNKYTCRYYDEFQGCLNIEKQLSCGEKLNIWLNDRPKIRDEQVQNMLNARVNNPIVWSKERKEKQKELLSDMQNKGKMKRGNIVSKMVVCENIVFNMVKDCANFYNMNNTTLSPYLTGKDKMPQKWIDRGLRYYNPETDKDLPIYQPNNDGKEKE